MARQRPSPAPATHTASTPSVAPSAAFPDQRHDHTTCFAAAVERAETAFETRGMRLTSLRRRVFSEIARSHDALGAYDILGRLAGRGDGKLAPISVYRAIDALLEAGVVHRVESRNAFFACHRAHPAGAHVVVLVCETCSQVAETDGSAIHAALERAAIAASFAARRSVIEVQGLCAACATNHGAASTAEGSPP
jgi:Fur family zinc uptake transcriptional regulator